LATKRTAWKQLESEPVTGARNKYTVGLAI
jgi:hypothetical protein